MNSHILLFSLTIPCLTFAAEAPSESPVFGKQNFIEYLTGQLPLVLSAPHGGALVPQTVATRTAGVAQPDANTQDLARRIAAEIQKITGKRPALIISHLHRSKLDPNREIKEAAQGDPKAEAAWTEYHGFISEALKAAVSRHQRAFFIDLHGQSHKDVRVELGYQHAAADYSADDAKTNSTDFIKLGSLKLITELHPERAYSELLFGPKSLGGMLETRGYHATPSPRMKVPSEPYFRGGYTVSRHVNAAERIAGLQIECNRTRLRDTADNRQRFAETLATVLRDYLLDWMKLDKL